MRIFIVILTFTLCGCHNRDDKIDKEKLLGNDYRLFQGSPSWDLAKAVEDENINLVKKLANEDRQPVNYQEPKFGKTLLMLAINNNDYQSAKTLLALKADPNIADRYRGSTAMHDAAANSDPKYLELLIKYHGNPNVVENKPITDSDNGRETPLNIAITYISGNNLNKVKLLVNAGADVNFYNSWYTYYPHLPLSDAISHQQFDIAQYLLEQGADYKRIMYRTVQGDSIYILGALRREIVDLDKKEYRQKRNVISFLKTKGLDYAKEPVPDFIEEKLKKDYPENWQEVLKSY
ncbi:MULTISPECIES: ankyrin repeat domain-containing protein [Sphingobacterium]|uniref:ankyrin repeat domain-containing protein n=1 Tax=Sphingobacterium TaxID=28453 RepID=UPI000627F959|nr:ankyrin repeat domain-containing protein [Sphingobacterium sp. Ag1]KKO93352.1 hypothetical protein AAW12_00155 [Sphingobacterium sp. Ag1]